MDVIFSKKIKMVWSEDLKNSVISYWEEHKDEKNNTYRHIGEVFGVPMRTVEKWVVKYKKNGTVKNDYFKVGRKRITSRRFHQVLELHKAKSLHIVCLPFRIDLLIFFVNEHFR